VISTSGTKLTRNKVSGSKHKVLNPRNNVLHAKQFWIHV